MKSRKPETIRVNVGGGHFLSQWSKHRWSPDTEYTPGSWGCLDAATTDIIRTTHRIAGTDGPDLFRTMRVGERVRYRFDVPNGTYRLELHFAEIYWESSDAEQQEVKVNGKTVLNHFNIFDQAGHDAVFCKEVTAEVKNGHIIVECIGQSLPMHSGARISAILVEPVSVTAGTTAKTKAANGPFNVVLVSFDTLRRDYVHAYGHKKPLSPVMDKLARDGVLFEDCTVNCGWTLPQHTTLLTGAFPIKHRQIQLANSGMLRKRFTTLAEVFQKRGYVTMGFGNQNSYGGGWEYGFYRGMLHYTTAYPFNNMMENVPDAIKAALVGAQGKPFFMYLHTNDTHEPFEASEPFGTMWGKSYVNRYEGEVTYVDHYLGKIIDVLKKLGVWDKTLLVVTSDHGSEFAEHGFYEKKLNLYEEISRIPLIMSLPRVLPKGLRLRGLCQTSDIAPTILDICSMPVPDSVDGKSLLPRIEGKRKGGSPIVFAHTYHESVYFYEHFSARTDRYKFIRCAPLKKHPEKLEGNTGERFARLLQVAQVRNGYWRELYDLKSDPREQHNIIGEKPGIARGLEKKLDAWIKQCGHKPMRPGTLEHRH